MRINLAPPKGSVSIKGIWSRLCVHIFYQMLITTMGGMIALKTDSWKAIIVFVLLIISNGVSVVVAFLDKSAAEYAKQKVDSEKPKTISAVNVTTNENDDQSGEDEQYG